jgi:hypothetical protein
VFKGLKKSSSKNLINIMHWKKMTRLKQRLGGALMVLIGAVFTGWNWYTFLYNDYFYIKSSILFPAVLVIGLGLIIFPGYREGRAARGEDVSALGGMKLITPRWWAILAVALAAGALNCLLLSYLKPSG